MSEDEKENLTKWVCAPLLLPESIRDVPPPSFYKRRQTPKSYESKYKVKHTRVLDQSFTNLDKIGKGTFGQVFK